jgi:hypothetical protein
MNDRLTAEHWSEYKNAHSHEAEFEEVDAAVMNSIDDFAPWLTQWMSFVPSQTHFRLRILLVWHAHFLSAACQQTLRRSLEQRSFRCRIWFHAEEPLLQPAIVSRCSVTTFPRYVHIPTVEGTLNTSYWDDPAAVETELQRAKK